MKTKYLATALATSFLVASAFATFDGPGQWYRISPSKAGKSWDLPGYSGQSGSLTIYDDDGGSDQLWYVREVWDWKRELIPRSNLNRRLDLPNGSQTNGNQLQVWDENGSAAQRFYIDQAEEGNYRIKMSDAPQYRLDNSGGGTGNDNPIVLWQPDDGTINQKFQFQNKTVTELFWDPNYSGHHLGLVHGDYNLGALNELAPIQGGVLQNPNDVFSSMKVRKGSKVILYQDDNFTGASVEIYDNVAVYDGTWNDRVSSVRVIDGFRNVDWRENFTGGSLDGGVWNVMTMPAGMYNGEWQRYEDDQWGGASTYKVVDGKLRIDARHAGGGYNGYRSARLNTKNKKSFYGGKFAARIKYNESGSNVQGLWPAFWTLGNNINEHQITAAPFEYRWCQGSWQLKSDWPMKKAREIDIWEWVSNNEDANGGGIYINNGIWGSDCQSVAQSWPDQNNWFDSDVWYEFSAEFYGGEVHFYKDNEWTHSMPDWPFLEDGQQNFVLLNMAVGGALGGNVNFGPSDWANIEIDYVYHANHSW